MTCPEPGRCEETERPNSTRPCNTQPCTTWVVGSWGQVSATFRVGDTSLVPGVALGALSPFCSAVLGSLRRGHPAAPGEVHGHQDRHGRGGQQPV